MKDKAPDLRAAFKAAAQALNEIAMERRLDPNAQRAQDDGRDALEKIRNRAPAPVLRPGGSMVPMAGAVDRKVREAREARKARLRAKERGSRSRER